MWRRCSFPPMSAEAGEAPQRAHRVVCPERRADHLCSAHLRHPRRCVQVDWLPTAGGGSSRKSGRRHTRGKAQVWLRVALLPRFLGTRPGVLLALSEAYAKVGPRGRSGWGCCGREPSGVGGASR